MDATVLGTPLAKALIAANLGDYAQAFDDKGYTDLDDLGDDKTAVTAAVAGIVPEDKPGVRNRIVGLWEATKKPATKPPAESLPLLTDADLKPGANLDLSGASVKIDDVQFAIPSPMHMQPGQDFGPADWVAIAHNTKLLYGLDVNSVFSATSSDSARAKKAALIWSVPADDNFVDSQGQSVVKSSMSYTSGLSNLVHNRIVDAQISIGTPFVSAAASASRNEKQASSQETKRLHMTGLWHYEMAVLRLRDCTSVSPDFLAATKAALAQPAAQQFEALKSVFTEYGHMVPATVTLGGQLYFVYERDTTGSVDETQVSTVVNAAVSAKYAGVAGSAKGGFSDGSNKTVTAQEIAEDSTFIGVGGDITLTKDPEQWAGSVKNPINWAVIARGELVSLIEWLDPATKASVKSVWDAGLKQAWGGFAPPVDYVLPDFDGMPFTIATSRAGRKLTPIYPYRPHPVADQMVLRVVPGPGETGWIEAQEGTLLSDPEAHGLLFQLLYTGKPTEAQGHGLPIYCLVAQQATGLYLVIPEGNRVKWWRAPANWSSSVKDPATAPTSWTLTPVDPGGLLGSDYVGTYLIKNVSQGLTLGTVTIHDRDPSAMQPADAPDFFVFIRDPAVIRAARKEGSEPYYSWVCTKFDTKLNA